MLRAVNAGICTYFSLVSFQHSNGVWLDLRFRRTFLPSPPYQQYNKNYERNRAENRCNNPILDRHRSNSWRNVCRNCWHKCLSWCGENLQNNCLISDLQFGHKYKVAITFWHLNCKVVPSQLLCAKCHFRRKTTSNSSENAKYIFTKTAKHQRCNKKTYTKRNNDG